MWPDTQMPRRRLSIQTTRAAFSTCSARYANIVVDPHNLFSPLGHSTMTSLILGVGADRLRIRRPACSTARRSKRRTSTTRTFQRSYFCLERRASLSGRKAYTPPRAGAGVIGAFAKEGGGPYGLMQLMRVLHIELPYQYTHRSTASPFLRARRISAQASFRNTGAGEVQHLSGATYALRRDAIAFEARSDSVCGTPRIHSHGHPGGCSSVGGGSAIRHWVWLNVPDRSGDRNLLAALRSSSGDLGVAYFRD